MRDVIAVLFIMNHRKGRAGKGISLCILCLYSERYHGTTTRYVYLVVCSVRSTSTEYYPKLVQALDYWNTVQCTVAFHRLSLLVLLYTFYFYAPTSSE
jgi:hypothetical protein